jgi:ubiquinone biosynthesis protein UbiJ
MSPDTLISPTLHTAAIAGLERAINQALKLDPATQQRLGQLEDHIFLLRCTSPKLDLYIMPSDGEINLFGSWQLPADTTLSGSWQAFSELATANDPANALINGDVVLEGDSNALMTLQAIAKQLDIDWEAPLANLFGDVIGHQMGNGLRKGFSFGQQAIKGLKRQFEDYLKEESELFPPRWQVDKFLNEVDQLAMRAERLEARMNKLRQQRHNTNQS